MFLVFHSIFAQKIPPDRVVTAKTDDFTSRDVLYREDGIVLYCPQPSEKKSNYEIVLHIPYTESVFSIYRNGVKEDTETRFIVYKDILPQFIDVAKEMENLNGLQKICDVIHQHPSWSLAHLSAYFGIYDAFNNPKVNSFVNSTDQQTGMSPLQVAIETQNIKIVQILVNMNSSLEHLDHNGQSVFHYAAKTNKDIIAVSIIWSGKVNNK